MSKLSIQLLRAPHIELDDSPVTIGHSKAVALLAYLVVTGRAHTRDALAGLLWPDYEQDRARGEVRRMLWALNKALGTGWLEVDRQTIALAQEAEIRVDVHQFRTFVESWKNHSHPGDEVCERCLESLTAAIDLYQADFLAGFSIPDSDNFEMWQAQETSQLRQDLELALDKVLQWYLAFASPDMPPVITYAQKRLAFDPAHEPTHRLLMACYARTHQVAAALEQFQRCTQTLQAELGIEPSEQTTDLYHRIRRGQMSLSGDDLLNAFGRRYRVVPTGSAGQSVQPGQPPVESPLHPAPHNLPAQITPFVGRKSELIELSHLLGYPAVRLISIVAPGGMGKTRLALELAQRFLARFDDGVFFVELAPLTDSGTIISAVAEAIGYQFQPNGRDQKQQVCDYLAGKEILLLLDNFEHLIDGAGLVADMLKAAPRLKVLATSRQRLNQTGETLFMLGGMGLPSWKSSEDAFNYASIELFQQTARRVRPDFTLTSENLPEVIQICRLVQGMPLGILLAASWLPVLAPVEIVAEIQQGLDILEIDEGEILERQRSIRVVFDGSWQLLKSAEQQAFMKMSIFRGGFTREAAREVTGGDLRQLQTLTGKTLIYREIDSGRYQIHELLRQYAAERLGETGQYVPTHDEYTRYYLAFLAEQGAALKGVEQLAALKRIEADFENIRGSWLGAIEKKAYDLLDQALEAMYLFCYLHSRLEDGKSLFDKVRVDLAPGPDDEPHPVWYRLGIRFYHPADDRASLEQALDMAQCRNDLPEVAFCRHTLGTIRHYVDQDPAAAIEQYEQGAAIYRQLDEKYYLAHILSKLGEAYQLIGRTELTIQYVNEAYDLQREIGDQLGESETLRALGMTAFQIGAYKQCLDYVEKSYAIQVKTGFIVGQASSHLYIGFTYYQKGDMVYGREQVETGLRLALDVVDYSTQAWCYAILSLFDSVAGNYLAAAEKLTQAKAIDPLPFRQTGAGKPFLQLHINWAEAMLSVAGGNIQEAKRSLRDILDLACRTESKPYLTHFMALTGLIRAHEGWLVEAVEFLGLVFAQPKEVTAWLEHWVMISDLRAELLDKLGGPAYRAAWQRGEASDLMAVAQSALNELQAESLR